MMIQANPCCTRMNWGLSDVWIEICFSEIPGAIVFNDDSALVILRYPQNVRLHQAFPPRMLTPYLKFCGYLKKDH